MPDSNVPNVKFGGGIMDMGRFFYLLLFILRGSVP